MLPLFSHAQEIPVPKEIVVKVIKNLAEQQGVSPILAISVAYCESRFDTKAINYNNNKTIDRGLMQINSIHLETAKAMGLDVVTDPIHNIMYGLFLLKTNGISDYLASKKCISTYAGQGMT